MAHKRPESVLVVVHTLAGEVLMLRRKSPADFWQSVTGSLEWGETAIDAARRELVEETGLSVTGLADCERVNRFPIIPPWRERYAPDAHENLEHVFSLRLPHSQRVCLNAEEHVEYRWVSKAVAMELASSYTNRDAIRELVDET